jgi:hypothetical protein
MPPDLRSSLASATAIAGLLAACLLPAYAAPVANGQPRTPTAHRPPNPDATLSFPPTPLHPNAAAGLAMSYSGTPIDALTYHYDSFRTGWNQSETDLTAASVKSSKFGLLKTLKVDGTVLAQPLLVSGYTLADGSVHDLLIVATMHNTIYAYDAQTYAIVWQISLGTSQSSGDIGCNDVIPEYGIASTPVIVRTAPNAATLYVVGATEQSSFAFQTMIHALDVGTGQDVAQPTVISPSATLSDGSTLGFSSQNQWNRAGLAYADGAIYVGIGSHCDNDPGNISGWLLRYTSALKLKASFHTIENPASTELASIWMTGFAPAIDTAGHVFVVTGNGNFNANASGKDYGESVLELLPGLNRVTSYFTPANFASLNAGDTDFGSGGVMLIPPVAGQTAPPLAVAMGKAAELYLLDSTQLGGEHPGDVGALQAQSVGSTGLWGGPAYYAGPNGPTVYTQVDHSPLQAYSVNSSATPALTLAATGNRNAGYGGSLPIVSSNGATPGTGVVWLIHRTHDIQLEAYDAVKLGVPLYTATAGTWDNPNNNAFVTPLEANGRVYVPASGTVDVFGLTP